MGSGYMARALQTGRQGGVARKPIAAGSLRGTLPCRAGSNALVAHPVSGAHEALAQACAQVVGHAGLAHGLIHAGHPLVTFFDADGKRHVPRTQARVAELVGVIRRAAQPAAQEPEEFLPGAVQLGAVGGAQFGVGGLQVHQVVEAVGQGVHAGLTPNPFKRGHGVGALGFVVHSQIGRQRLMGKRQQLCFS